MTQQARRLSQGSSVKDDVGQVYVLGDETFAQVVKMSRDIRTAVEQLSKLIAETRGLKANDASVISELTLLRDQADTFSQDLVGLAASVEGQTASIHDISAQEMSILASVVETLLDVNDTLESLKASVVGLNTHVKDHPCPWAKTDGLITPEARIAAISKIVDLLPTLQVVLAKAADREGFTTKEDGTDPQKKYWARKYLDKFRDAIVATIFSTLAGGAVGIMAWSYFFGTKSVLEKAKIETKKAMHNQLVQSEEQRQLQAQEIQRLKDELERYKARGTQRKPLPPR